MPISGKRKNSAGKGKAAIDRPFAPEILRRARQIVDGYQIIVRIEDGEYVGRGLEMPESIGVGDDAVECVDQTRAAMVSVVAFLLERGEAPPLPASEGQRTEQVNVRLTAEEKLELDTAARQRGYRGVADFFRGVALAAARSQTQRPAHARVALRDSMTGNILEVLPTRGRGKQSRIDSGLIQGGKLPNVGQLRGGISGVDLRAGGAIFEAKGPTGDTSDDARNKRRRR